MKSKFLEVFQHSIVYGIGSAGQQLIGFFLLPMYTSYLIPDDYGRLALITAFSGLLSIFLNMGFSTSLFRFYFKANDLDSKKKIISSALFWLLGVGCLCIVVLWRNSLSISGWILGSPQYFLFIRILAVNILFNLLQFIPSGIFRAEKRSWQYIFFALSDLVFGIGLNVYFITTLHLGLLGILLADVIATGVIVVVELYFCRHLLKWTFSWPDVKSLLVFGLPLISSGVSIYLLNQADRWFLRHYVSLEVVGVYSLGYKLGQLINVLLVQPLQMVWLPIMFEIEHQGNAKLFYGKMLTYVLLIDFWAVLGLSLFSKELLVLMTNPDYYSAYTVIPWISLAYVMYGAFYIVNIGILLLGKTIYSVWMIAAAGLSNIVFNLLLIPSGGALGAAIATLLSYSVLFGIAWWINRRIYPIQYQWNRILKTLSVFFVLLTCGQLVLDNIYVTLIFKSFLMIAYWGVLWLIGFYEPGELGWLEAILKKHLRIASSE